jgi:hypothetical protein
MMTELLDTEEMTVMWMAILFLALYLMTKCLEE